jgi:hypothetical protein
MNSGARHRTFSQLKKGSQFFRLLKIFNLEKNSDKIWEMEGLIKVPCSSLRRKGFVVHDLKKASAKNLLGYGINGVNGRDYKRPGTGTPAEPQNGQWALPFL